MAEFNQSGRKTPCYKCRKRSPGCHDHCTEYQQFVDEVDAIRIKRAEQSWDYGVGLRLYLKQQIEAKRKKRSADAESKK